MQQLKDTKDHLDRQVETDKPVEVVTFEHKLQPNNGWQVVDVDLSSVTKPDRTVGTVQIGQCSSFEYTEMELVPGQKPFQAIGNQSADVGYGAKATGACDDIDAYYSGKSAGNPDDIMEKGAVRKTYHGGVRPDHMMFASIADEKAQAQEPRICCPNCGQAVVGLDGAKEAYPVPKGMNIREEDKLPPRFVYQVSRCGCRVNQEWVTAYSVEMNRRKAGETPKKVVDMNEAQRAERKEKLEKKLVDLYVKRDKAADKQERDKFDYLLLAYTDMLMKLCPGKHNKLPPVLGLSKEVKDWAEKNNIALKAGIISTAGALQLAGVNDVDLAEEQQRLSDEFGYSSKYPMPKALNSYEEVRHQFDNAVTNMISGMTHIPVSELQKAAADGAASKHAMPRPINPIYPGLQSVPKMPGSASQQMTDAVKLTGVAGPSPQVSDSAAALLEQMFGDGVKTKEAMVVDEIMKQVKRSPNVSKNSAAWMIAQELRKSSAYDRADLLEYMEKGDAELTTMVRSAWAQLDQGLGSVDGKKVDSKTPATVGHLMAHIRVAKQALHEHHALCVQIINCAVEVGCGAQRAIKLMDEIRPAVDRFIGNSELMPPIAAKFCEEFIRFMMAAQQQKKATLAAGPTPVGTFPGLTREEAVRARREHFHQQFDRPKRIVRLLHRKKEDREDSE